MTLRHYLPLFAATLAMAPWLAGASLAEPEPRIGDPVRHEAVAVYFLRGPSAPGAVPDTLQEALAKGSVVLHETGNVRELKIENTGDRPVFVQFGDIVKGGRQDRVLSVSLILDPRSGAVPIGSFCVEQGRWSARGGEDARRFALSESMLPSREAKLAIAKPHQAAPSQDNPWAGPVTQEQRQEIDRLSRDIDRYAREITRQQQRQVFSGEPDSQGEVWRSVDRVQRQLAEKLKAPVASDKSRTSLQLALENEKLKAAQAAYLAVLEPAGLASDDIVGVVVAIDGRISGADIYPSNGLFRKMWPKLARAAATEALTAKPAKPDTAIPTLADVAAFLAQARDGVRTDRLLTGVARIETRATKTVLHTQARTPKGDVVHHSYLAR